MYGVYLHFYSLSSLLFYVLIWILSIFSSFFFFFTVTHSAFYCPRSLGLALSLGLVAEHSCKANWIAHRGATLWVSGIIAPVLHFPLLQVSFALSAKALSYGTQNRAFSALIGELASPTLPAPAFFLMDKSNLNCHFLSLKSAIVSSPLPTQLNNYNSSVVHLPLFYLDGSPSNALFFIPRPLQIIWPSHFSYLLCTQGHKRWWLWLTGPHSFSLQCVKTFWVEKLGSLDLFNGVNLCRQKAKRKPASLSSVPTKIFSAFIAPELASSVSFYSI